MCKAIKIYLYVYITYEYPSKDFIKKINEAHQVKDS